MKYTYFFKKPLRVCAIAMHANQRPLTAMHRGVIEDSPRFDGTPDNLDMMTLSLRFVSTVHMHSDEILSEDDGYPS